MIILLFILIGLYSNAQITNTSKVIYKATKADTITFAVSPIQPTHLTVKVSNEVIENNVLLSGYHVLNLALDSGDIVTAQSDRLLAHTIYRNGVNVTPALVADNSFAEFLAFYNSLTTAQKNKLNIYGLYKQGLSIKQLKKSQ